MKNYTPQEVQKMLKDGSIVLIDVRESDEHASERIQGAILCPLSAFDPHKLPDCKGKSVVFHCAGGVRSATAISKCFEANLSHDAHLAGGIKAWKSAGLPTTK